jgi:hypothetical protein
MMRNFRWFENNDLGAGLAMTYLRTPRFIKKIYAFVLRYIYRDPLTADLISNFHEKTVEESYKLIVKREGYRARWLEAWQEQGIDFLLTVPNACPAIPHGGMKTSVASVGYTFLFNLVSRSPRPDLCILSHFRPFTARLHGRSSSSHQGGLWTRYPPIQMESPKCHRK